MYRRSWLVLVGLIVSILFAGVGAAAEYQVVINPTNSYSFFVLHNNQVVMRLGMGGWGPNWGWASVAATQKATNGVLSASSETKFANLPVKLGLQAKAAGPRSLVFDYSLDAAKETPVTMVMASVGAGQAGPLKVNLTDAAGQQRASNLPVGISSFGAIQTIAVTGASFQTPITFKFDSTPTVTADGDLRIQLASGAVAQGQTKVRMTIDFPGDVALRAGQQDVEEFSPALADSTWFAYQPKWPAGKSAIGVEDWLEKPAGKRGGVRMVGDAFQLEDGTPIKFWGTNLSYGLSAPQKADADFTAARFAKYGVNAVRMHKFTGAGWEGIGDAQDATKMVPAGLDRLDYFSNKLREQGVYYGWSHSFGFKVRPGNKDRLLAYDELMKKQGNTYAVINWAEDCQDLMIEMVVDLLKHKNPYSNTTYAQDPALSYIELQNEDDIFFYTSEPAYNDFPTYRKFLQKRFSEWLATKYATQAKLAEAWPGALKADEKLEAANIAVTPNPWNMGSDHLPSLRGGQRQRMLDNAEFLHDTQNKFYAKFIKAIRDTGYKGPICGSPWQAPAMLPHYYNLRSDYLAGYIDRHNYYGDSLDDTMLAKAGSGYLSSGLQQVVDRPFGISEWIHVYPALFSAEGPVLMAAYGMGLQGWDCSYEFQSVSNRPAENVGNRPWGVWNADVPTQIGQYPILSRMVLRGDVKQSEVISSRRVSMEDLRKGEFNFSDKVQQSGDVKTFTGSVPAEALAAGRSVVEFVEKSTPSTFPDMAKYMADGVITSATGQLRWDTKTKLVTIDTPGTQGYVGFAAGKEVKLAQLTIRPETNYASILATAADKTSTLQNARSILISAMARNANSGFRILSVDGTTIVENGKPPVLLEPVKATISISGRRIAAVRILDHDGLPTGRTVSVKANEFTIDGTRDKAIYYELTLGEP